MASIYQSKGLSAGTAWTVAEELAKHDAFAAHADAEPGIDPDALTSPWHASVASAVAFTPGALLPLVAILLAPASPVVPVTFFVVLLALVITGTVSASLGGTRPTIAVYDWSSEVRWACWPHTRLANWSARSVPDLTQPVRRRTDRPIPAR